MRTKEQTSAQNKAYHQAIGDKASGLRRCRRRPETYAVLWADVGYWVRAWVCARHAP